MRRLGDGGEVFGAARRDQRRGMKTIESLEIAMRGLESAPKVEQRFGVCWKTGRVGFEKRAGHLVLAQIEGAARPKKTPTLADIDHHIARAYRGGIMQPGLGPFTTPKRGIAKLLANGGWKGGLATTLAAGGNDNSESKAKAETTASNLPEAITPVRHSWKARPSAGAYQ